MSVVAFYFGWPHGAVWSNLVASLLCVGAAYLRLQAQQERQHVAQIAHQRLLHQALKAHVSATALAGGGCGGDCH